MFFNKNVKSFQDSHIACLKEHKMAAGDLGSRLITPQNEPRLQASFSPIPRIQMKPNNCFGSTVSTKRHLSTESYSV